MLRPNAGVFVLALLPLAGCASVTTPPPTGDTIFEIEYVNFAWVPTWRGFAIDSTGAINSYDLEGRPWQPVNAEYPTRAELMAKHAAKSAPAGFVDAAELQTMQERAGRAVAGPLSAQSHRCADAGTFTYSAWLHDPDQGAFRRVLLWREGDVAQLNQSGDGRAVAQWLMSLRLVQRMDGCQP